MLIETVWEPVYVPAEGVIVGVAAVGDPPMVYVPLASALGIPAAAVSVPVVAIA